VFVSASRVPSSRFTRLSELKETTGPNLNVQGIVFASYVPEKTAGADLKSVLMLVDPSVPGAPLKVNLFFPRLEDHPYLSSSRVGDVFRACNVIVRAFRSKLEITLSVKNGATYEVLDGDHNNTALPRADPPKPEEAELLLLRDFRLQLMADDAAFARRCSGPGVYMYRSYPPKPLQLHQQMQNVHQQVQQYSAGASFGAPPSSSHVVSAPPLFTSPALPLFSAPPLPPVRSTQPAPSLFVAPSNKKSLGELTFPVNGTRGYFADLGAVRLLSIDEPVQGKRLALMLWDGTGPRSNSMMPHALAETVQATCWEPATGKQLLDCGAGAWVELCKVRISPNKQKEGELEVHINDTSIVRKLDESDALVQSKLRMYAEKEAKQTSAAPSKVKLCVFVLFVLFYVFQCRILGLANVVL
jgi:hypothetical protein